MVGQKLNFVLASFQTLGTRRTQIAWLGIECSGLKPSQELLNGVSFTSLR